MVDSKTNQALDLFKSGKMTKALSLFKTFKIGFSNEEQRTVQIAYEALTGKATFYEGLGINTAQTIEEATALIKTKYNL